VVGATLTGGRSASSLRAEIFIAYIDELLPNLRHHASTCYGSVGCLEVLLSLER